jgi:hypothetical protein
MDPITAAIIAAVLAGAAEGLTEVSKNAIVDTYNALKAAIQKKLGKENNVTKAITELEGEKNSKGRQIVLEEQVSAATLKDDAQLLALAQKLTAEIKAQPATAQYLQTAYGSNIAQASGGSTATVTVQQRETQTKQD